MEGYMRKILSTALMLGLLSCSSEKPESAAKLLKAEPLKEVQAASLTNMGIKQTVSLDEIAEAERAGGFTQGMGLSESILREKAGDLAGAVLAAYKELAWAYGYGFITRESIEEGFTKVKELGGENGDDLRNVAATAQGVLSFAEGKWADAESLLKPVFQDEEEPDAFSSWMLLVCALETGQADRHIQSAYSSIRARYVNFPEYWYRGARYFTGTIGMDYAEHCINLAPSGTYSEECRSIIAKNIGFGTNIGILETPAAIEIIDTNKSAIRSRVEIENTISESVQSINPVLLSNLFPLLALPDNSYTLYAVGAMRTLSRVEVFRNYFQDERSKAKGRLAERLAYISR
jgi:hypothetical protein